MYFELLYRRLIAAVRTRLRNGELSERRLARLTGISQPHIHNVLKGARTLSPELADCIVRQLRISATELIAQGELGPPQCSDCMWQRGYGAAPVLEGWLGPGLPLPRAPSRFEAYPFPAAHLAPLERPAVARLAPDERMPGVLRENDLALLDHSLESRACPKPGALYVVSRNGEGLIRRVRADRQRVCFVAEDSLDRPERWEEVSLDGRHILDIVRAKVTWIGRRLA